MPVTHDRRAAETVTAIAAVVAIVVAILVPVVYFVFGWQVLEREIWLKSQVKAELVSAMAARAPDAWAFQDVRLQELLRREPAQIGADVARVTDANGNTLVSVGQARGPVHWGRHAVHDAGMLVGYVEVGRGLAPLLSNTAAFALLGLTLSLASFFALRTMPLRALDRAITALGTHLRYEEKASRYASLALAEHDRARLIEAAVSTIREGLEIRTAAYVTIDEPPPPAGPERLFLPVGPGAGTRGALSVIAPEGKPFAPEAARFAQFVANLLSAALQRVEAEAQLRHVAQYDALTRLPNRGLLSDRLAQQLAFAARDGTQVALLYIDLDGFKAVNDSLGHAGGDELLRQVGARLTGLVRVTDTVGRLAGDEFAIACCGLQRAEDAALMARKVIDAAAMPYVIDGKEIFVSASIGIAVFPGDGEGVERLLAAADAAMYRAKHSGRNAFQFFAPEMHSQSHARAQQAVDLRRALEHGEFLLHYQPVVCLATGKPTRIEALLRWQHPERGLVRAADFIQTLEETGLIQAVGEWAIRRACEDLASNAGLDAARIPVAVNLSARQFRRPDLDARIAALLAEFSLDARLLELEITESQLMSDPEHAVRMMRSLRGHGLRVTIDDFGTGYSSLAYLTKFPVECLKIDRSFIRDIATDPAQATVVRTIIDMAKGLGILVIAEGVETAGQLARLREMGCEHAQGYLYACPMPWADALRWRPQESAVVEDLFPAPY